MAEIRIRREHALGLHAARRLAYRWAEVAGQKLEMACSYREGATHDVLHFRRSGAHGELRVWPDHFDLHAKLGLLLGVFKHRIETEIVRNLDDLLAQADPHAAFEHGLAQHEARKAARHHGATRHHEVKPSERPSARAGAKPPEG